MKKTYNVTIRETLGKTVQVEAESDQEARDMVIEDYYSENIVLTADDYTDEFDIDVQEVEEE